MEGYQELLLLNGLVSSVLLHALVPRHPVLLKRPRIPAFSIFKVR
jgi:hypothetical protein